MKKEPKFTWDAEKGQVVCELSDGQNKFIGAAYCHPDDFDMKNEMTGCEIASRRAFIKYLKFQKKMLKERLGALNQLYHNMIRSKHFNENSYENKMLQSQIHLINSDLATIKEMVADEEQRLKEYINLKDNFYKTIRKNRKSRQANSN